MIHLPLLVSRKIRFYMMFPPVPSEDIKVVKYYENNQSTAKGVIPGRDDPFYEFCELVYGWRACGLNEIYKILHLGLVNISMDDLRKIRKYMIATDYDNPCGDNDDLFDEVYNDDLLDRIQMNNMDSKYGFYSYDWNGDGGMYFGINVRKYKVGNYGEPQFGMLNKYEVPLDSLLAIIRIEKKNIEKITQIYGSKPTLHVITKAY